MSQDTAGLWFGRNAVRLVCTKGHRLIFVPAVFGRSEYNGV